LRINVASRSSLTSISETRRARSGRACSAASTRAASAARAGIDQGRVIARRQTIDDRQIELRVIGTELVDEAAAVVNQVEVAVDAADAHRLALGDRHGDRARQDAAHRCVGNPRRTEQLAAPFVEIDGEHVRAADAIEQRDDFSFRETRIAADGDSADRERVGGHHLPRDEVADSNNDGQHQRNTHGGPPRQAQKPRPACRCDMGAAETTIGWGRDRHQPSLLSVPLLRS
jgi:hypothetical protein